MVTLSTSTTKMYKTKQEYVYQVLKEAIMNCDIQPSEKLVISNIASQLQVSAIPVREALQNLQSERLVTYNQHVGAVVSPITENDVVETFTIKEGLESSAAGVVYQKITEADKKHVETYLQAMDEVVANQQYEKWGQLNAQFHQSLVQITNMPVLIEMHTKVLNEWTRIRRYFFNEVLEQRHERLQSEHREIFQAIINGHIDKAERLIKAHNQQALNDYMAHLDE